jgi:hypothetical protein
MKKIFIRKLEICLEENAENTGYIYMSCEQYAGQNQTVRMGNKSFEYVEHFNYFGKITITNQNCNYEEITAY